MEQSAVQFGQTAIPYSIRRGRRLKTVAVTVDPVEGVYVRAPGDTPTEKLDQIVLRKARWIILRRQRVGDIPPAPSPREFVSGETFLYLGRQYRLKIERDNIVQKRTVRLKAGLLHVPLAPGESQATKARASLVAWYRGHAGQRLPKRVTVWAERFGEEPTAVLIRDQRKRWGSADEKGVVRLNWRLIQAPRRLIDYVVAHELVHLRHRGHTREFWGALGQLMSDYEESREALRQLGPALIW